MTHSLQLGASLYVPATRMDLAAIGNRVKYPRLRSVIFCLEDAVRPQDLPQALLNLEAALPCLEPVPLSRFVRVRNPEVLGRILQMEGVQHLAGFVLPKVTLHSLDAYGAVLPPGHSFELMPLLETVEVFNPVEMAAFRQRLGQEPFGQRVLSLRIGGNDLLQLLGLRRPRGRSIYTTPLAGVIDQLVATFRPHGWNLTGPVFERLDCPGLLAQETRQDLAHSLFGKSAIHPDQVPVIEAQYRADWRDLEAAQRILDADAPAVFQWDGSMCEPAVHRAWAEIICARARLYGIRGAPRRSGALLPSVGDTGLTPTSPRHKRNGQAPSGKGRR